MKIQNIGRFELDMDAFRDWIPGEWSDESYSESWDPRLWDYAGDVDNLVNEALTEKVLRAPEGLELYFELTQEEDRNTFMWIVHLTREGLPPLRLITVTEELRKLGDGTTGQAALFAVLSEGVTVANGLLDDLGAWTD